MLRVAVVVLSLSQGYVPTEEYVLLPKDKIIVAPQKEKEAVQVTQPVQSFNQTLKPKQPSMNAEIGQKIKMMILDNAKKNK